MNVSTLLQVITKQLVLFLSVKSFYPVPLAFGGILPYNLVKFGFFLQDGDPLIKLSNSIWIVF